MDGVKIRELEESDYEEMMHLLSQLTTIGTVDKTMFVEQMTKRRNTTTLVAVCNNKVCGTVSILFEYKFTRSCSTVAHIEDLVVDSTERGNGIGKLLIQHAIALAQSNKCYKVILDCSPKVAKFYKLLSFKESDMHMRLDM